MNWTIDFKGGSEIIFAFKDKASGDFVKLDPGKRRSACAKAGEKDIELSDYSYTQDTPKGEVTVNGTMLRSPRFFFFQAEDGIRDLYVTGVQTCALPISSRVRWLLQMTTDADARAARSRVRSRR